MIKNTTFLTIEYTLLLQAAISLQLTRLRYNVIGNIHKAKRILPFIPFHVQYTLSIDEKKDIEFTKEVLEEPLLTDSVFERSYLNCLKTIAKASIVFKNNLPTGNLGIQFK